MLIQQLRFDGFLSFAPGSEPFELRPLNVLIGPNGSGKSNLIEALGLLAATPHDLAVAVRAGGGAREWLWKGQPKTDSMEIEAVVGGGSTPTGRDLRYRLNLGSVRTRLELLDEAIEEVAPSPGKDDVYFYYRFQRGHPAINIKTVDGGWTERRLRREDLLPDQSVLAQRKDPEQYPEVTWVGRRFSGILVFNEWTFGRHSPPRDPQPADLPDDRVLADSSNLAHILNRIEHAGDTRINGLLKTFFPRFERLTTRVSGGTVQFHLRESGFEAPIPSNPPLRRHAAVHRALGCAPLPLAPVRPVHRAAGTRPSPRCSRALGRSTGRSVNANAADRYDTLGLAGFGADKPRRLDRDV